MEDNHFKFSASVVVLPFLFVLGIWSVFWIDVNFNLHLRDFGIYPRTLEGLRGVALSPFLHGSVEHLYNNSIPLLILIAALRYFYREKSIAVIFYGILLSGFITWVIGRDSYHIGASGLIYVLVSFIFFKGISTKYYRLVALSLLVILVYGSLVWYVFPIPESSAEKNISWEGHLGGLIAGFVFSILFKTPQYRKLYKYDWEVPDFDASKDKFLQRFDADGNFVNIPKPDPEEVPEDNVKVIYSFIPKDDSSDNANT